MTAECRGMLSENNRKTEPAQSRTYGGLEKVDSYILIKMRVSVILCIGMHYFNISFRSIIILTKYRCLSLHRMVEL